MVSGREPYKNNLHIFGSRIWALIFTSVFFARVPGFRTGLKLDAKSVSPGTCCAGNGSAPLVCRLVGGAPNRGEILSEHSVRGANGKSQ